MLVFLAYILHCSPSPKYARISTQPSKEGLLLLTTDTDGLDNDCRHIALAYNTNMKRLSRSLPSFSSIQPFFHTDV